MMDRRRMGSAGSGKANKETRVRIGCAGWTIPGPVASSFDSDGSHLERYARVFSCVEINSSFYRAHQPKTYARWAASVPDDFRFSVKMPRTISHDRRLEKAEADVASFLEQAGCLGDKLGCLLLQLPPSLALDRATVKRFFTMLRRATSVPVVCEPRHATWFTAEGRAVMSSAGVDCVQADPLPVKDVAWDEHPGTLYIRLHGSPDIYYSSYDDAALETVAQRIANGIHLGSEVWCIFDNTARGAAVPNALNLMRRLQRAATDRS